jgi:hypothetical protein
MKKILISFAMSFAAIVCCFLFINPFTLTPLQFVPIIALVYVFSALALYILVTYLSEYKARDRLLISIVLAFSPTILCALMTLGTVSAIDIVLAVTIPTLITWYTIRIKTR